MRCFASQNSLNMLLALFRLGLRRIDHERVMHLIIVALVELSPQAYGAYTRGTAKKAAAHTADHRNERQSE